MADKYGGSSVPLPVIPADGSFPPEVAVGDPVLAYLADFLKTIVVTYAGDAWDSVQRGKPIVRTVHTSDPEDGFSEGDLPCLYVFRPGRETREMIDTFDYLADDFRIQRSRIEVQWIMDPAPQEVRRNRNAIGDGIRKVIDRAIETGRDPAWKVPGDPDSKAAQYGSSFTNYSGISTLELQNASLGNYVWKMQPPAPSRKYDQLKMSFLVEELLAFDLTIRSDPDNQLQLDVDIPDEGTGLGDFDVDDAIFT